MLSLFWTSRSVRLQPQCKRQELHSIGSTLLTNNSMYYHLNFDANDLTITPGT